MKGDRGGHTADVVSPEATHLRPRSPSIRKYVTQEEGDGVLREKTGTATRRHEKSTAKRRQSRETIQINAESPYRAEQEVIIQTSRKIRQGPDQEGARDGTRERLRLGHKVRDIRKAGISVHKSDN